MQQAALQGGFVSRGQQYSLALHLVLLLFMIFGLPDFLHRKLDTEPMSVSVEILPVAPISNVKPKEQAEPEEKKLPKAERKTELKAHVEAHQEEKPKEKPVAISTKAPAKKPEKKLEKKKVERKQQDDLASVLKSVEDTAKSEESRKPTEKRVENPSKTRAESQTYNAALPLSMSEKDAIREQFKRCWNPPAGAKDASNLIVTLDIKLNADGSVTDVKLAQDSSRYNSDSFFRAAADSAMRAVHECSPLKNLPADKYGSWNDMELTFDPKDLI